jgi:hypothetical protein
MTKTNDPRDLADRSTVPAPAVDPNSVDHRPRIAAREVTAVPARSGTDDQPLKVPSSAERFQSTPKASLQVGGVTDVSTLVASQDGAGAAQSVQTNREALAGSALDTSQAGRFVAMADAVAFEARDMELRASSAARGTEQAPGEHELLRGRQHVLREIALELRVLADTLAARERRVQTARDGF